MPKPRIPCPTEEDEQATLFSWAQMKEWKYPDLHWMFHIPNGGQRKKSEAARMVAEGVKPGVSDILLPAPCGQYHGLFIELKRLDGGRCSKAQIAFIEAMQERGYYACFRCGWAAAAETIVKYLEGPKL